MSKAVNTALFEPKKKRLLNRPQRASPGYESNFSPKPTLISKIKGDERDRSLKSILQDMSKDVTDTEPAESPLDRFARMEEERERNKTQERQFLVNLKQDQQSRSSRRIVHQQITAGVFSSKSKESPLNRFARMEDEREKNKANEKQRMNKLKSDQQNRSFRKTLQQQMAENIMDTQSKESPIDNFLHLKDHRERIKPQEEQLMNQPKIDLEYRSSRKSLQQQTNEDMIDTLPKEFPPDHVALLPKQHTKNVIQKEKLVEKDEKSKLLKKRINALAVARNNDRQVTDEGLI